MSEEEYKPLTEILVPMDFSDGSVAALKYAMRVAAGSDARLHLLYVDDEPILMQTTTDQSFRDQHADKMCLRFVELLQPQERERFRVVMDVRFGTAYYEIESYAMEKGIEMIVMGNLGRSAIADALLGSVTAHVIRHAPCPVLSIKQV